MPGDAAGDHAGQIEDANAVGAASHRAGLTRHVWITIQVLSTAVVCSRRRGHRTHLSRDSAKNWASRCITRSSTCSATGFTTGSTGRGTQIPSEHDLSRELGVSRVTLREALRELVRENLLVKIQGKGTFVASNPPKRLAPVRYTGFLEELQERVRKLRVTDVEIAQVAGHRRVARRRCSSTTTTSELTMIRRLRHIDDQPFSFTQNYLPTEIGARIRQKDLYSMPLLKILQEDLKIPIIAREGNDRGGAGGS